MMPPRISRLLIPLLGFCLLAACTHSRVVRRDYDDARPTSSSTTRSSREPSVSRAAPSPIPSGAVHVVRAGETLYGISFRYGLRYQDVATWNGISDPYTIEIGQRLRLRPPAVPAASASRPPPSTPATTAPPRPRPPGSSSTPRPITPPPIANTPVTTPTPPVAGNPPPRVTPQGSAQPSVGVPAWHWPTQGQIVGRYVAGDQTRQGINIAGSAGQPVLASADGVVVYSGAGLVGYGELIIIKHSDEWLSAYAHNRKRLVAEGTRVRAGDAIAEMGRSGANRDMLHFEIRRNGKPVDPLQWLPKP